MMLMVDACEFLECIQKKCRGSTEKVGSLSINNAFVRKFKGSSRCTGLLFFGKAGRNNFAVIEGCVSLFQKKFDLAYFFFSTVACEKGIAALIVTADDLLAGSFTAYFVINDAVSGHIDTHICRGFVRAFSHDLFKHCLENREDLYVTVVVDGCPVKRKQSGDMSS